MSPEEPSLPEIGWRLTALEHKVEEGFATLRADVKALEYVRDDVYQRDLAATARSLDGTRAIAMWALGLVASLVVVMFSAIIKVVTG